jgi:hypothetical protein
MKAGQLNAALETCGQGLDDAGAKNRFGAIDGNSDTHECNGKQNQKNAGNPAPASETVASPRRHELERWRR